MRWAFHCALSVSLSLPLACFAFNFMHGDVSVQFGGFGSSQGKSQDIDIVSLVGNHYTVNKNNSGKGLFGIGYFVDVLDKDRFKISYGINGFYLGKTSVSGTIIQEHEFTNLAYSYKIQHVPVFLAAKANVKTNSNKYNITFDAGVGPDFIRSSQYNETPLDNVTLPDNAFTTHSNVGVSAMAGVGLRLNNVFGKAPLECGYRFFYLGQGRLQMNNNQLLDTLKSGNSNYANALLCSIIL